MVVVTGSLICSDGTQIPVLNDGMSNGTSAEVQTNTAFSVVAASVGTYAAGKTVVASTPMVGTNSCSWAYLLRRGQIIQIYPVGGAGSTRAGIYPLLNSVTLLAGDQLICMPVSASDRECTLAAATNQGNMHLFTVTPSGAGTNTLTSIITSNGIGDTFQGQTIVQAWASSVDGIKLTTGGGLAVLNDKGVPVGVIQCTDANAMTPQWVATNIPIALNYAAQAITSG